MTVAVEVRSAETVAVAAQTLVLVTSVELEAVDVTSTTDEEGEVLVTSVYLETGDVTTTTDEEGEVLAFPTPDVE